VHNLGLEKIPASCARKKTGKENTKRRDASPIAHRAEEEEKEERLQALHHFSSNPRRRRHPVTQPQASNSSNPSKQATQ